MTVTALHGTMLTDSERERLTTVMERTKKVVLTDTTRWWSAEVVSQLTGDKPESIRRMFRYMRSPQHGAHSVEVQHVGSGLHTYRIGEPGSAEVEPSPAERPLSQIQSTTSSSRSWDDLLDVTGYLVMEVLAGRYRAGRTSWILPARVAQAIGRLQDHGLIESKVTSRGSTLAWLTPRGVEAWGLNRPEAQAA